MLIAGQWSVVIGQPWVEVTSWACAEPLSRHAISARHPAAINKFS